MNGQLSLNISASVPLSNNLSCLFEFHYPMKRKKQPIIRWLLYQIPFISAMTCVLFIGMLLLHSMSQNTLNIMTGVGLNENFIIIVFCNRFQTRPAVTEQGT